ncbi:MAG TPA: TetR/AcrR family transcriptional regulator [Solirubrobacteraceae bacterium]|nr:TetR/AcrR family transcriptional regulator [Solirubrobacteraceae bacterium]
MPRRSAADARSTRAAIVERAVAISSVDGLEGLTIGRLAGDLEMSKAGVLGHFGTKERLQLAALDAAIAEFVRLVWEPATALPSGLPRLLELCDRWIAYLYDGPMPGGCFVTAVSTEFDGREGPVRDAVREEVGRWLHALAHEARVAVNAGDLPEGTDPDAIAFQLNAIAMGTNQAIQLLGDLHAADRGRAALRATLGVHAR